MFLTGQDEIEAMATQIRSVAKLNEIKGPTIKVCPLYSQLPQHQQLLALKPSDPGFRKIVLATNIAETSLTISGIKYVIDSGVVKSRYVLFNVLLKIGFWRIVFLAQKW